MKPLHLLLLNLILIVTVCAQDASKKQTNTYAEGIDHPDERTAWYGALLLGTAATTDSTAYDVAGAAAAAQAAAIAASDPVGSAAAAQAFAIQRANHTGTQAQSTITNLVADLAAKAASIHTHLSADVTDATSQGNDFPGKILKTDNFGRINLDSVYLNGGNVRFVQDPFTGMLNAGAITDDRTWDLPDATGTIALTSDLTPYAPLASPIFTGTLSLGSGTWDGAAFTGTQTFSGGNTNLEGSSTNIRSNDFVMYSDFMTGGSGIKIYDESSFGGVRISAKDNPTNFPTIYTPDLSGSGDFVVTFGTQAIAGEKSYIGKLATTKIDSTLAASATTLAVTNNFVKLTGDAGGNTIATITGGISGQTLTLLFVDALVTITDTDAATANTVDLSAAFTSTARDTLTLIYDGTKWIETSRSIN